MKKNERAQNTAFVEAQAFTMAVMQSLIDTTQPDSRMLELATNAHDIAVQAIDSAVTKYPVLGKVVDKLLKEITVSNERG
jgi:hypothetical protein